MLWFPKRLIKNKWTLYYIKLYQLFIEMDVKLIKKRESLTMSTKHKIDIKMYFNMCNDVLHQWYTVQIQFGRSVLLVEHNPM